MADASSTIEVEPLNAAHDDFFDIIASHNCMGMDTFEYSLSLPVDEPLLKAMGLLGQASFPLGRERNVVKIDEPEVLLIEGVMGLRRLRITLRVGVSPKTARLGFEQTLATAIERC